MLLLLASHVWETRRMGVLAISVMAGIRHRERDFLSEDLIPGQRGAWKKVCAWYVHHWMNSMISIFIDTAWALSLKLNRSDTTAVSSKKKEFACSSVVSCDRRIGLVFRSCCRCRFWAFVFWICRYSGILDVWDSAGACWVPHQWPWSQAGDGNWSWLLRPVWSSIRTFRQILI